MDDARESQILRRAGACMMFLFTDAPTQPVSPLSHCNRLVNTSYILAVSSGSRTVPRLSYLDVMWSCFYKTAFLQRPTSFVTAVPSSPFTPWSIGRLLPIFYMLAHPVPLHSQSSTSNTRFISLYWLASTEDRSRRVRARYTSDSKIFTSRLYAQTRIIRWKIVASLAMRKRGA